VPDAVLELEDVTKSYAAEPPVTALAGVSFSVHRGELVAIVGPSGSGKSTLLHLMGTLDRPSSGIVRLTGLDVARMTDRELSALRATRIGFVFQQFFLAEHATALENVADGLLYSGASASARRTQAVEALARVGLGHRAAFRPTQLSGGERQRVAIARALAANPKVLIADEPTSMLDVSIRIGILNLMSDLQRDLDFAVLLITHDLASARYVADTVLVMYAGQIVEQGPAEQVLQQPLHPYTRLLLASVPDPARAEREPIVVRKGLASAAVDPAEGCRFVERCPLRIGVCTERTPELVEPRPGQSARCHVTAPSPAIRKELDVDPAH
jgi:putative ABC transport system ATP-binding protein